MAQKLTIHDFQFACVFCPLSLSYSSSILPLSLSLTHIIPIPVLLLSHYWFPSKEPNPSMNSYLWVNQEQIKQHIFMNKKSHSSRSTTTQKLKNLQNRKKCLAKQWVKTIIEKLSIFHPKSNKKRDLRITHFQNSNRFIQVIPRWTPTKAFSVFSFNFYFRFILLSPSVCGFVLPFLFKDFVIFCWFMLI